MDIGKKEVDLKLLLSDDEKYIMLKNSAEYKQCEICIETSYYDAAVPGENIKNYVTLKQYKKIVISAARCESNAKYYLKHGEDWVNLFFKWQGVFKGKCCVQIQYYQFVWNKDLAQKEACSAIGNQAMIDYVGLCCKERKVYKQYTSKRYLSNRELIDFHMITKQDMIDHIKKYGIDIRTISMKESDGDKFVEVTKTMLQLDAIYDKFIRPYTKGLKYEFDKHPNDSESLDLYPTNEEGVYVHLHLQNLPFTHFNINVQKDEIVVNGNLFLNLNNYGICNRKDGQLSLTVNPFVDHKICKINYSGKKMMSKAQYSGIRYNFVVPYVNSRIPDIKTQTLTAGGLIQYRVFAEKNHLHLELLGLHVTKVNPDSGNTMIVKIHSLEDFTQYFHSETETWAKYGVDQHIRHLKNFPKYETNHLLMDFDFRKVSLK